MRKLLPLLALLATAAAGCGGNPGPTPGGALTPAQQAARVKLIKTNQGLNDLELAHLCPAIYPKDALDSKRAKHYGYDGKKITIKAFTRVQVALATSARCGTPIPLAHLAPVAPDIKKTTK